MKKLKNFVKAILESKKNDDLQLELKNNQVLQRQLFFNYNYLKQTKSKLPEFSDTGFRVFSQGDEDGLILYIFSIIGFTNKTCVDIAFFSPYGANTTNLICNWGFKGLLIEGQDLTKSQDFFNLHKDTYLYPPKIVQAWITAENVNDLCKDNGVSGEIDFLSLDMDGVDYWVWNKLEIISPRVIVVEYQDILGPNLSITVPYTPDFNRLDTHPDFFSASLLAFVNLAKKKGYRLVGINSYGYNAFFVKNGICEFELPEISVNNCFSHPKVIEGIKNRYPEVENLPWIEV